MGLHTAEPDVLGDRYFGLGVHRAARLCAVGHGGQVLLSRSTAGLVDEDEVAGVALRDLGEHLLKDLDRPERIYQLVAEGLATDFPPIKTVTEIARRTEVPSGTVSFVATDMVGFRQLFGRESDFSAAVLEEYDRLLRNAFAEKGYVVEVVGDAFVAAFRRAKDAVRASAAAQKALESGDWPEGGQPKVKIGIHTGEAQRIASRYLSLTLLRAFHVCEAAAGGQVLLSQATENLLDANDLAGLMLHDLGARELPEFERPVHLYEVVADSATPTGLGGNHATAR
jgi:class 3 adenylate cyclase